MKTITNYNLGSLIISIKEDIDYALNLDTQSSKTCLNLLAISSFLKRTASISFCGSGLSSVVFIHGQQNALFEDFMATSFISDDIKWLHTTLNTYKNN